MNRFQHAKWATVLELRAMAIALQKNVYVMENTHSIRLPCVCYPAQPWSRNDARAQHFRLYEICDFVPAQKYPAWQTMQTTFASTTMVSTILTF